MNRTIRNSAALVWAIGLTCSTCLAQVDGPAVTAPASPLAEKQQGVAERYQKLESLLLRSSEIVSAENPSRAALLRQAVQLSKQYQLADSLVAAAKNLDNREYSEAIQQQKTARANLERILQLLQSEDREKRVREQRDQVRRWIEETDRLLRLQSSLRGRTEGGQEFSPAAENQGQLASKAEEIAGEIGSDEHRPPAAPKAAGDEPPETQPGADSDSASEDQAGESAEPKAQSSESSPASETDREPKAEERPTTDQPPADEAPREPSSDGDQPSTEPDDSESQPPKETAPSDAPSDPSQSNGESPTPPTESPSEATPGEQSSGSPPADAQPSPAESQTPTQRAQQKIEQAQSRMREAQQALENAEREGAIAKQREAEENLREAVAQLEQILRQLREEEIERSLASLEIRLRRMLEMQSQVLDETQRLHEISGDQQSRQVAFMASKLSLEEKKILADGERAYLLLKEEGSSAAFPEAIEQVNADIAATVDLLDKGDVGKLTVIVEQEIVSALEEMVEALVKVQKENQQKSQQPAGGQANSGQPGDQPLVDKLAELRLVRTLQVRINNRTAALSQMLAQPDDAVGQAEEQKILSSIRDLAERQDKIGKVTRTIVDSQ